MMSLVEALKTKIDRCGNEQCVSGGTCLHERGGKKLCCACANAYEMGQAPMKDTLRTALNSLDGVASALALVTYQNPAFATTAAQMKDSNNTIRKVFGL